ncbi:MAG: YggS family pyridoxal phosphate-dependent enzyme [Anaerolineaceae bacterium]|nr:YggS family pyridoxal phosphate-dependent enzyme [Anaerolineaceae bacterium]
MEKENPGGKVSTIKANLARIQSKIDAAAARVGRDPQSISLLAVTKLLPLEVVQSAYAAGLRCFGENYPEQAVEKIIAMAAYPEIEWHMIGSTQSRKAELVSRYFNKVHSVDRLKIARYLNRYCGELDKVMPILIEVNLSGEESKAGFPAWHEDQWTELTIALDEIVDLPNLNVRGLMTMPPLYNDPELSRPIYRKLKRLQQSLKGQFPDICWDELSIGTSFDYEVAVEEGATVVRIGTELFGPRPVL